MALNNHEADGLTAVRRVLSGGDLRGSDGGPSAPFATGTRSLLLRFAGGIDGEPVVTLGAVIDSEDRMSIAPGDRDRDVRLQFWADEAEVFVNDGSPFELHYGREVGHGVVLGVERDRR